MAPSIPAKSMSESSAREQTRPPPLLRAAYVDHFGLRTEAFSLAADPAFLHMSPGHAEALAALKVGVLARRGLILMVGEVGTGKTTLIRCLSNELGPKVRSSYVSNTRVSFEEILRQAIAGFGIECEARRSFELLGALTVFLHECEADGETALLAIDEAQNLDDDTLERLRLLSNCETNTTKLLQIVLVGQPELATRLEQTHLRQLANRVAVRSDLYPLGRAESIRYIASRLECAGGSPSIFTDDALRLVARKSRGIPRSINILCHNAMLFAYADGDKQVSKAQVRLALKAGEGRRLMAPWDARGLPDKGIRNVLPQYPLRRWLGAAAAVLAVCTVTALAARVWVTGVPPPHAAQSEGVGPVSRSPAKAQGTAPAASGGVLANGRTGAVQGKDPPVVSRRPAGSPDESLAVRGGAAGKPRSESVQAESAALASQPPEVPQETTLAVSSGTAARPEPGSAQTEDAARTLTLPERAPETSLGAGGGVAVKPEPDSVKAKDVAALPEAAETPQEISGAQATGGLPAGLESSTVAEARAPAVLVESGEKAGGVAPHDAGGAQVLNDKAAAVAPGGFREVKVPHGSGLRALAREVYGDDSAEILSSIQRANPQIAHVDRLKAGDVLQFPELQGREIRERGSSLPREVRVPAGVGLRALARGVYGNDSESIINQIKKANPQITDADRIRAGDRLRFPALTEDE